MFCRGRGHARRPDWFQSVAVTDEWAGADIGSVFVILARPPLLRAATLPVSELPITDAGEKVGHMALIRRKANRTMRSSISP